MFSREKLHKRITKEPVAPKVPQKVLEWRQATKKKKSASKNPKFATAAFPYVDTNAQKPKATTKTKTLMHNMGKATAHQKKAKNKPKKTFTPAELKAIKEANASYIRKHRRFQEQMKFAQDNDSPHCLLCKKENDAQVVETSEHTFGLCPVVNKIVRQSTDPIIEQELQNHRAELLGRQNAQGLPPLNRFWSDDQWLSAIHPQLRTWISMGAVPTCLDAANANCGMKEREQQKMGIFFSQLMIERARFFKTVHLQLTRQIIKERPPPQPPTGPLPGEGVGPPSPL